MADSLKFARQIHRFPIAYPQGHNVRVEGKRAKVAQVHHDKHEDAVDMVEVLPKQHVRYLCPPHTIGSPLLWLSTMV